MDSVLVVDDSRFMRTVLKDLLSDHGYEVYTARNGKQAVEYVQQYEPDVVTMDVHMPKMDGIEAVEQIMARQPTPIIMLSAHTDEDAEATLDALEKGALDFMPKPGGEVSIETSEIKDQLLESVEALVEVDAESVSTDSVAPYRRSGPQDWFTSAPRHATKIPNLNRRDAEPATIIIGASTGGPSLIEDILEDLPVSLNARILIVQHMPEDFTPRFADRLDELSGYTVREAEDGSHVAPGEAMIAPGDGHMVVSGDVDGCLLVHLEDDLPTANICPSIDATMTSASETTVGPVVGVALTGMGEDGSKGVKAIKDAGGHTIAQDEETSPVFGIPKRAIETGCVDKVLPDSEVVHGVVETLNNIEGDTIHG